MQTHPVTTAVTQLEILGFDRVGFVEDITRLTADYGHIVRAKFEAEAPERLTVKMWLHPIGTWAAIAGMAAVLLLMATSKTHAIELWTSVIVTAAFMLGYWGLQQVKARG